ncbi:MSHA biogenesis protein MshP [uncultured Massilia sp.]|uniref:MSHA biogenesis protein MshP n=1 Tax=uncultured Massilia sp. TaxID=169973 RepID=UPI0025DE4348|nr:MSHA biogenesis protein MshP [uncultured Massilia sp.]
MKRAQGGFAYVAAVVFLVVLAGLAAAVLRLNGAQQATVSGAMLGMRAGQAARGGLEWAFYQLRGGAAQACNDIGNGPATPANPAANGKSTTLGDFAQGQGWRVTVTCTARSYGEGEVFDDAKGTAKAQTKLIFELNAWACNGAAAACPDNASAAAPDYVERRRSASICVTDTGGGCY